MDSHASDVAKMIEAIRACPTCQSRPPSRSRPARAVTSRITLQPFRRMDRRLEQRMQQQRSKIHADGSSESSSQDGACDDFRVDMQHPIFGICKCGWERSAHAQTVPAPVPVRSSAPSAPGVVSENSGIALARERVKRKEAACKALGEVADEDLDALTVALAEARDANVDGSTIELAERRRQMLQVRQSLCSAESEQDLEAALRRSAQLEENQQHQLDADRRAAWARLELLRTDMWWAQCADATTVEELEKALRGLRNQPVTNLRTEMPARAERVKEAIEAAKARLIILKRERAAGALVLAREGTDIDALLACIGTARLAHVFADAIAEAEARLLSLRQDAARVQIEEARDRIDPLRQAILGAQRILPEAEIRAASERLVRNEHARAREMLDGLSTTFSESRCEQALVFAVKVDLPQAELEEAQRRLLEHKMAGASVRLREAMVAGTRSRLDEAIKVAQQVLPKQGQPCDQRARECLRDELEAARARRRTLVQEAWRRHLAAELPSTPRAYMTQAELDVLPANASIEAGSKLPSDVRTYLKAFNDAIERVRRAGCPEALLVEPRARSVALEGLLAQAESLLSELRLAVQLGDDADRLSAALNAAVDFGMPRHGDELRAAERLIEDLRREEVAAESRAQWEALCDRNFEVPNEFICPISLEKMVDPVQASDGHTYERVSIEELMRRHGATVCSPLTRERLTHLLVPNQNLKKVIQEFEAEQDRRFQAVRDATVRKERVAAQERRLERERASSVLKERPVVRTAPLPGPRTRARFALSPNDGGGNGGGGGGAPTEIEERPEMIPLPDVARPAAVERDKQTLSLASTSSCATPKSGGTVKLSLGTCLFFLVFVALFAISARLEIHNMNLQQAAALDELEERHRSQLDHIRASVGLHDMHKDLGEYCSMHEE